MVQFCEARVCGVVREPANAYSSLAYVAVGLYLLHRTVRDRAPAVMSLIGFVGVIIGIGSFAFHATTTWYGEVLDLVSMYWLICLMLTLEIRRFVPWSSEKLIAFFFATVAITVTLLFNFKQGGIVWFGVPALTVIILELVQWRTMPGNYRSLLHLQGTFFTSFVVWAGDLSGVVCLPNNHVFNGHAFWHIGSALVLVFYYLHHRQFTQQPQPAHDDNQVAGMRPA